eukprot:4561495-Amphidinium_carterae.1
MTNAGSKIPHYTVTASVLCVDVHLCQSASSLGATKSSQWVEEQVCTSSKEQFEGLKASQPQSGTDFNSLHSPPSLLWEGDAVCIST